jgi:hypothetical protein
MRTPAENSSAAEVQNRLELFYDDLLGRHAHSREREIRRLRKNYIRCYIAEEKTLRDLPQS